MSELSFANKDLLYLLLLIPVLIAFFIFSLHRRKKALDKIGNSQILKSLMPEASSSKPIIRFSLICLSLVFLIIAAARPRAGGKSDEKKSHGSEILILLDISNSMRATDMYPSRLENAKNAISNLIKKLSDDKVGLIIFAGEAYVQSPITSDFQATDIFVQSVSCDMISEQGTALGAAVELGMSSFGKNNDKSKAMILITDGENHETNPDPISIAKDAADKGIVIHTIGIGSNRGVPIPVSDGQSEFMRDRNGNVVMTKLDESVLMQIADATGGLFVRATNADSGLGNILKQIRQMEKTDFITYSQYNEKFVIPLSVSLVLFLIYCFMLVRKNRWISKSGVFD